MEFTPISDKNWIYYLCKTKKFKNVIINLTFLDEVRRDEVTALVLLSRILNYSNSKYKTSRAFNAQKEYLYGSSIYINSRAIGKAHHFSLTFNGMNPKFFDDKEYSFKEIIKFIYQCLNPYLNKEQTGFNEKIFEICRDNYYNNLLQITEDKELYLYLKLLELSDKEHGVSSFGYIEEINKITNQQCYELFKKVLSRSLIIHMIGDIPLKESKRIINSEFNFSFKPFKVALVPVLHQNETNYYVENLNFVQSIIGLTLTTKVVKNDELYYPMFLLNMILGGESFSKLFMVVREKYGFCYSISSTYDNRFGTIYIIAGLEAANKEKALKLIEEQISALKLGKITKKELKLAKARLMSDINGSIDSPSTIINRALDAKILGVSIQEQEMVASIKEVTIDDLCRAAEKIQIKDIYFLKQS